MLHRVIEDRRREPRDDLITLLVETELDEEGERHLLTDEEIYGFARLILTAGSGTTWRQLGILLVGCCSGPSSSTRCATTVSCCGAPSTRRCAGRRPTRSSAVSSPRT